jgi:DNA repair protein RecO (recombination protein O)
VAPRGARGKVLRLRSHALLVRRVVYGEADLIVTLFTEERGLVSAIARSARRSTKRFSSLEPMFLLDVTVDERPLVELGTLVETAIVRPRLHLAADLGRLDAAGRALRWLRRAAPPHTPEPELWREINELLDALDASEQAISAAVRLATTGLRLLVATGWGLELTRCVVCGKACDPSASACLDPARGGLVCRACGGAPVVVRADRRARLLAAQAGADGALLEQDAEAALAIVEAALAAHAGMTES